MSIDIIDRRSLGNVPYKNGERRAYTKRRKLHTITGLGWHHTARAHSPLTGDRDQRIAEAIERAGSTPYHVEIFRDLVVVNYPFDLVTWHGNALNYPTIGVAVAGRFPKLEQDFDPSVHDCARDFEEAISTFLQWLDRVRMIDGSDSMPALRWIMTHSQVANKPADPGETVTRLVITHGARLDRPLVGRADFFTRHGEQWPAAWAQPYAAPAPLAEPVDAMPVA